MNDQDAWSWERRLWLEGADAYEALLHGDCVMAFPAPVGLLKGADIVRSLENAPRWDSVSMDETVARTAEGTVVLGYRAEGRRGMDTPYRAYCTSTYRLCDGQWRLIQHQQTPVSD